MSPSDGYKIRREGSSRQNTSRLFTMLALAVLVALLATSGHADEPENEMSNRIIGGEDARIEDYPSMLALTVRVNITSEWGCGASILNDVWALTAGHCVEGSTASQVTLKAGSASWSWGGSRHNVAEIILHEEYKQILLGLGHSYTVNDVALLKVEIPFPLNDKTIQAARLPAQDQQTPNGAVATAIGWGDTSVNGKSTDSLKEITVSIVEWSLCEIFHRGSVDERNICIRDEETARKGAYHGDSGGPLYVNGEVVGVASSGSRKYDDIQLYPDVYTSVSFFRNWIAAKTGL